MTPSEFNLRFEAIFNTVIDGIITISKEGIIESMNPAAAQLFGYSPQEMIGRNVRFLMPDPHRSQHDRYIQQYQETGIKKIMGIGREVEGRRKDGSVFPFFLSVSEVILKDKTIYTGIIHDISAQKNAEKALRESEKKLSAVINSAIDGIITIDERGIILIANPAVATLFGYEPSELIGSNVSILMEKSQQKRHDAHIYRYMTTGEKRIIGRGREEIGKRKDGSTFPCLLSISEVRLDGKILFTGIVHDLTRQKANEARIQKLNTELENMVEERTEKLAEVINRLLAMNKNLETEIQERKSVEAELLKTQEEVRKALEKERELNELKSRFVSMASHEFRTPLSTILSSVSLIARYNEPNTEEKRLKHVHRIKAAVNNLTGILNDFLSLSRLEEGRFENNPEWFDFRHVIENTIEDLQGVIKPNQSIHYQHTGLQKEVFLDKKFFKNICINLLSNAIKYSEKNITFQTELTPQSFSLQVQDSGIGIPEEEQQHLFTRFFRAKNATNIQGTGLGLNIVQRYLDLMGGSISFKSVLNEGTTFTVIFPIEN